MSDAACPRVGRLFGGCRFRPRYDTVGANSGDAAFWAAATGQSIAAFAPKSTYLGDVCETCGKTLFRRVLKPPAK